MAEGHRPEPEATPSGKLPPWLLGLLIALFVFLVVLVVFSLLGVGDDPVVGSLSPGG